MIPVPEEFSSVEHYIHAGGEDLEQKIDLFLKTLTKSASEVGLMVKPDKTCVSREIIIYGKDLLRSGAFLPQALKRISRTLPDVNEIYPTMETKTATVQTSGAPSSQKSLNYVVPYVVSTTETLTVVMREIHYIHQKNLITKKEYRTLTTKSFKDFLMHLSSVVGGCSILNPLHFFYQGHPDHFTAYTSYLHLTAMYDSMSMRMYNLLSTFKLEYGKGDPELLISNPCSVNLKSPVTIGNTLRQDLEKILIHVTKNKDLRMIFSSQAALREKEFFEYLVRCKPCHPRVLHEVLRSIVQGAKLAYISKYKNTKTTRILYGQSPNTSGMTEKINRIQVNCFKEWLNIYYMTFKVSGKKFSSNMSPTTLANTLRVLGWINITGGNAIEGVTIPHRHISSSSNIRMPP
jgi:hypothetical protein